MLKALLIGGTRGGETVEVEDEVRDIRLVSRRSGFQSTVSADHEHEIYARGEICDSAGRRHTVFVKAGEDAVQVLMEAYRRA